MTKRPLPNRTGFTLIELLCTLLIGSLVIVLLSGMVAKISKEDRRIRAKFPSQGWQHRLRAILEKDLASSDVMSFPQDGLSLEGYMPTDLGHAIHSPSRVNYRIEKIDGRKVLVRSWTDLSGPVGRNFGWDYLCEGVVRLEGKSAKGVDPGIVKVRVSFEKGEPLEFVLIRNGAGE